MKKLDILNTDVLYMKDNSIAVGVFKIIFRQSGVISEKKRGVAKMMGKILSSGTKKDGLKFYEELERKAINFDISAGFETFVIEINCLKEHFSFALKKLDELLNDINFDENRLKFLKDKTISKIKSLNTEFDYIAKNELNKLLFPNEHFAYQLGDKDEITDISITDLKEFYDSLGDFFIVVGGDVEIDENKISKIISNFRNHKKDIKFINASNARNTTYKIADTTQAYIYFGAPFNVSQDEIYKANLSTFILGSSGFGSRLMENIRVKNGLAYSAYARNDFSISKKYIYGYLQTQNENLSKAIDITKKEFDKFVSLGVTQKEFNGAKEFIVNSSALLKETMFKRLQIYIDLYYYGLEFDDFEKKIEKIKVLSFDDINHFIKEHKEILDLSIAVVCNEHS